MERENRDEIEASVDIMTTAIQRYSRECVNDVTTSVVPLPNEIKERLSAEKEETFARLSA